MVISSNKKAYFDYEILESVTAGIVLTGPEVKAVKNGRVDLKGSFASVMRDEVWLKQTYIAPYDRAKHAQTGYDPYHERKLLLTRKQIATLIGKTATKGITLVPLKILNKNGLIKVELGLGKGKRKIDKRETIKKRDFERKRGQLTRQKY